MDIVSSVSWAEGRGCNLNVKVCGRKRNHSLGEVTFSWSVCDVESQKPFLCNQDNIQWCTQVNKPKCTSPKITPFGLPRSSVWVQEGGPGMDARWGTSVGPGPVCLLRKPGKCRGPCLRSHSSHCFFSQETLDSLRCSSLSSSMPNTFISLSSVKILVFISLWRKTSRGSECNVTASNSWRALLQASIQRLYFIRLSFSLIHPNHYSPKRPFSLGWKLSCSLWG